MVGGSATRGGGGGGGGCRPVARGVQMGAIARSTWQTMNIIHLIVYCSAIYTYLNDNCQLSVHVCILCTYACKSTGTIQM